MENYKDKYKKHLLKILDYFVTVCEENELTYYLGGGTLLGAIRHDGFIPWDDDIDVYMPRKDYEKLISMNISNDVFWLDNYKTNKKNWNPYSKIRMKKTCYKEEFFKNYDEQQGFWIDIFPIDNTKNNFFSCLNLRKSIINKIYTILFLKITGEFLGNKSVVNEMMAKILKKIPFQVLVKMREFLMKYENNDTNLFYISFGSRYRISKQLHLKSEIFPLNNHLFESKYYKVPKNTDYVLSKIYGDTYLLLPPKEYRVTHNPLYIQFPDGEEIYFNEEI